MTCVALAIPGFVYAQDGEPLTLENAIELAVTQSELVQASQERATAAAARLAGARAFFFPELTSQGVYTRRQQENVRNVGGTNGGVS